MLMTDKTVALSDLIPVDNWNGFQFHYILGGIQFNIIISDLLKGQTAQQDLLWVPRLCDGSFGFAPPSFLISDPEFARNLSSHNFMNRFTSSGSLKLNSSNEFDVDSEEEISSVDSSAEEERKPKSSSSSSSPSPSKAPPTNSVFDRIIETILHQDKVFYIDAINRVLSETRFGRNLAVSRKSKRTRITAFKEETARLVQFRLPIRAFFGEPSSKYTDCLLERPKKKRRQRIPAQQTSQISAAD